MSGAFLVGYGVLRFIAEFFREPDNFLGLLALGMSMGQWLCVPMIVAGIALWAGSGRAGDAAGCAARAGLSATMRQIFLDTETTGLSPESGDRVIEIGCVEMRQPAPHRPQPALLPEPRAAQPARTRSRCTA